MTAAGVTDPQSIRFHASACHSVGIEVELVLVDAATGELVSLANEVLADVGAPYEGGEHPKAKHELFQCTVEVITGICDTVPEAGRDLRETIGLVDAAAVERGARLVSAATHPFSHWREQRLSPGVRYSDLVERLGWPARRLAIQGLHVHIGVGSGEAAVAITHALCEHLPLLLALSASSPFWHGLDTSLASVRTKIFESLPNAGLPPQLASWDEFELFMHALLRADVISSIREVWWDVRPHPDFGTVELRMCDAVATLEEVLALAALSQCLVADLQARVDAGGWPEGPRDWVVRQNKWLAARHGLGARLLVEDQGTRLPARELLGSLVDTLLPTAQRLGCAHELTSALRIAERGGGHDRLRAVVTRGGTMREVVDLLREEFTGQGGYV
jgi:carboxylate-amine ligase